MERHANYALVGLLTSIIIVGGLIFAVWLGHFSTAGTDKYRIVFRGPVRGLAQGGDVQFNGIKVGEIKKIDLVPGDGQLIIVNVSIKEKTPVRVDSLASTEMEGISGVNVVEISAGSNNRPLLREASRDDQPLIKSKSGSLASLLDSGKQVMQGADEALGRVNRILSDDNIAALSASIGDIHALTASIAQHRQMFANADATIAKLNDSADDIKDAAHSVRDIANGDGKRAADDVAAAAKDLRATLKQARGVMDKIERDINRVGDTTLPNLDQTLRSVQETSASLNGLVRQIKRDPRGTLGKPSTKELEPSK